MKKIIITADDYGMCQPVDTAIEECIAAGAVTTTNVLLNMETPGNAGLLRTRYPHVSVGIHWNVTAGKPLLAPDRVPSLVDGNGDFYPLGEFKRRMRRGMINKRHLEAELQAQYEAFYELCGRPDYWNTHENSALCLRAFNVFSKLAKGYGIPGTRNFRRVYIDIRSVPLGRRMKEFSHKVAVDLWFGVLLKKKYVMPDARLFPFRTDSKYEKDKLIQALNKSGCRSVEIVAHPAAASEHKFFGNLSKDRLEEYAFFSNDALRGLFETNGLILTNFAGISG